MKIPETSPVWEYFSNNKDITITSYLIYGSGNREDTHKFLRDLNVQIAYPMLGLDSGRKVSSVFLIGEKKNNKNFSLGELKFIKEVTNSSDTEMLKTFNNGVGMIIVIPFEALNFVINHLKIPP
jgi:hypothetical protein